MQERVSSWVRSGAVVAGLIGAVAPAWAANVDLTVSVAVPAATTLTPFIYTIDVGNAQTGSVATNAALTVPLPANLYNVSVQRVTPSGPGTTVCPTPADFTGGPAGGAVTSGSEVLTATIPALPANGFCRIEIAATPLAANSYTMVARVAAGAGDAEVKPETNTATGNTATTLVSVPLKVDKTIVSGATHFSGDRWDADGYNLPIVYEVRFENQSAIDLPLGAMGDAWSDWEGNWAPQSTPQSSTLTGPVCMSGNCPPLNGGTVGPNQGTGITPFTANLAGYVLQAGQTVVLRYTRTYAPPVCGQAQIANDINWNVNQNGSHFEPQWQPNSYYPTGAPISRTVLTFPVGNVPACTGLGVRPLIGKTLDRVTDAAGAVTRPRFAVSADGDQAHFTITIDNTRTDTTNWPASALAAGAQNVSFSIWDVVRSVLGNAVSPTVYPDGEVTQAVFYEGCSFTGAASSGSACPGFAAGSQLNAPSTNFTYGQYAEMKVAAGQTMTIRLSTRYAVSNAVQCVRNNAQIENFVGLTVQAALPGFAYTGDPSYPLYQEATTADKISLLPDMPRCADVSANKTMSPANPRAGETITFTLDYVNSTSLATANPHNAPSPLTNVGVADVLGSNFTASSVSCRTLSGTATPPSVSLADITGGDRTFAAVIPSMDDGAVVRCEIQGSISLPGSYRNTTAVALAPGSAFLDPYADNNQSSLNYGIIGPRVELTKVGSVSGNTVTFTVTASSRGEVSANGTRVTDVIPPAVGNATWRCREADGAVCPAAEGSGNIDQTIATFPSGSSVTWTITGTLTASTAAASITNSAQAALPPGASCVTSDPAVAPTASPCVASATVASPVTPQVAVSTAFAPGATPVPNGTVGYTVTFSNPSAVAADGAQISDPLPAGVASQTWSCVGEGGAICPAANGSGPIAGTVTTFPAGGRLVYTVTATLNGAPPATLTNNALITPPTGGVCASGAASPCTATASTAAGAGGGVVAVPVDAPWALALLSVLIGWGALRRKNIMGVSTSVK